MRSTTELRDSGREGSAGVAAEPGIFDDEGMAGVVADEGMAADEVNAVSWTSVARVRGAVKGGRSNDVPDDEAARPLSHGFGGDGVAISPESRLDLSFV